MSPIFLLGPGRVRHAIGHSDSVFLPTDACLIRIWKVRASVAFGIGYRDG